MIGAILMLWSSNATAQQRLAVGHCVADLRKLCPGVPPGNNNLRVCMREHIRDVSFPCLVTLANFADVRGFVWTCRLLNRTIEGYPSRISMCHFLECQRRTGAVISNQARFRREQVTFAGKATAWMRTAESGNGLTFHFCPTCGSTVYWEGEGFPCTVAVDSGNFAHPKLPPPNHGVGGGCTPLLGLPGTRDATQARRQAGVIKQPLSSAGADL